MIKELRNKSNKELGELVVMMKSKLLEYRFRTASGELNGTHKIKMVKKTIAIALTVLSERNIKISLSSNDHSLIEVKDGILITKSFKEKGTNSIIFEKNSETESKPSKNKDLIKKDKTPVSINVDNKKTIKKITTASNTQKSGTNTATTIRKASGKGQ